MANTRERRERYSTFGRDARGRFTSRWEIVLVLIVVAAGIVITTIAAIKAKEKSDLEAILLESSKKTNKVLIGKPIITSPLNDSKGVTKPTAETSVSNIVDSSLAKIRDDDIHETAPSTRDESLPLPPEPGKKVDFDDYLGMVPDYDAEYDSIESRLSPVSVAGREKVSSEDGTDNLPGFPPPNGTTVFSLTHSNQHADLAADGAGFLFESPSIVSDSHDTRNRDIEHFAISPQKEDFRHGSRLFIFKTPDSSVQQPQSPAQSYNEPRLQSYQQSGRPSNSVDSLLKSHNHHHQHQQHRHQLQIAQQGQAALFNSHSLLNHLLRASHAPQEMASAPAISTQRVPESMNNQYLAHAINSIANLRQTPRLSQGQPQINAPIFSNSHFGMPTNIRAKRSTDSSKQSANQESSEESTTLPETLAESKAQAVHLDSKEGNDTKSENEQLKSEASGGYFAFDEEDPELLSLFNLGQYSKPSPQPMKTPFSLASSSGTRRSRKRRPQTYFPMSQSSTKQSYGILGSGNFEIIRGGIYSEDDETKSGSDTHYARGMSESVKPSRDFEDYSDTLSSKHPYSTEEYFGNNPVLGFQGYDNFKAASDQEKKIDTGNPNDETTSPSSSQNVHVFVDHELMAAS